MTSKETLKKAATENIIEQHQVEPLYQFIKKQSSSPQTNNKDEPLKFIRSFGDVFITLGIILLATAINMLGLAEYEHLIVIAGFIGIAEWLVRLRRLVLPGMVILLTILFFINKAIPFSDQENSLLSFTLLSVTSLAFYLRYKIPFSLLPMALGLVAAVISLLGVTVMENTLLFTALGLLVFTAAMWFDSRDTERTSYLSDCAFWLHLLAAPLIVHGTMISLFLTEHPLNAINNTIIIMAFFVVFFLLALFIDRRAMLISTQLYMIYAITQLMQSSFVSSQNVMIYILMILGLFVIFFGTYWYKTRRIIFGALSNSKVSQYVPDFSIRDSSIS